MCQLAPSGILASAFAMVMWGCLGMTRLSSALDFPFGAGCRICIVYGVPNAGVGMALIAVGTSGLMAQLSLTYTQYKTLYSRYVSILTKSYINDTKNPRAKPRLSLHGGKEKVQVTTS